MRRTRTRNHFPARSVALASALSAFCLVTQASADAPAREADRVAVRYTTPETGGAGRPRFLTERELAFFARLEAHFEQSPLEATLTEYPERYVRAAMDRLIARSMLANLLVQRGVEPPDLPRLADEAKAELEARLGGPAVLLETMQKEGIEAEELQAFFREEVRAAYYIDKAITPILAVTEEALREAFRALLHPFRGGRFDDVRVPLRRWLVNERLRAAEIEFLQGARARIKVSPVRTAPRDDGTGAAGGVHARPRGSR